MKNILKLTAAILLSTLASTSFAGDASAGKAKSMTCAGCHGNNPMWPNLAGQKQAYLASALQMYRDGRRKNAMMSAMAKNLTDADIANLAAYYTSLK
jgi:cytochrome c553